MARRTPVRRAALLLLLAALLLSGVPRAGNGPAPAPPADPATVSGPAADRRDATGPEGTRSADGTPAPPPAAAVSSGAAATPPVGPGRRLRPSGMVPPGPTPEARARAVLALHGPRLGLDRMEGTLVLRRAFTSMLGEHVRFRQVVDDLPVEHSEVSVHWAPDGRLLLVNADIHPVERPLPAITVDAATALARALDEWGPEEDGPAPRTDPPEPVLLPRGKSVRPAWRVDVGVPGDRERIWVDAATGEVLETRDLLLSATGTARVFDPNPIVSGQRSDYVDAADAETAPLAAQIREVTLERLDGSGFLRGQWVDTTVTAGTPVQRPDGDFRVPRSDPAFEPACAYFHVDRVQQRIHGVLGFDNVVDRAQLVDARFSGVDNSFFDPETLHIELGTGGVDDGEDGDVAVHEFGHAIQYDQVENFGITREGGAMGEGFGDYLACGFHTTGNPKFDHAFGSWDAVSFETGDPPALRRVDTGKKYPVDYVGQVHADGEIWSGALWDMRQVLGADTTDRLVIASHFLLTSTAGFHDGAVAVVIADQSLHGGANGETIKDVFADRGIAAGDDTHEPNNDSAQAAEVTSRVLDNLYLGDADWFRFDVEAGGTVDVTAAFGHPKPNLEMRLYDASLTEVDSSRGPHQVETVTAVSTGGRQTYFLHVYGFGNSTGLYDLIFDGALVLPGPDAFEPNDDAPSAAESGAALFHGLTLGPDEDWYRVPVGANTTLTARAWFDADLLDLDLEIRDVGGELLATSGGTGNGESASITAPAPEGGVYLVRVHSAAGTGSYSLQFMAAPLQTLQGGSKWVDVLGPAGFRSVGVRIPPAEGRPWRVRLKATKKGSRGAVPEIEVFAPVGNLLHPFGTGARKKGARLDFETDTEGVYRIDLRAVAPTSGEFKLKVRIK